MVSQYAGELVCWYARMLVPERGSALSGYFFQHEDLFDGQVEQSRDLEGER